MPTVVSIVSMKLLLSASLLACVIGSFAQDLQVRGASITLKVPSFSEAQANLVQLANGAGGKVADQRREVSDKGKASGWFRVIVPKAKLDSLIGDVRSLGSVYGENLTQVGHQRESTELEDRATRLAQHRDRLAALLDSKRNLRGSDLLYVQERLFRAGVDQDMLRRQKEALASDAANSSVIVTLFEPDPSQKGPRGPMGHIAGAFHDAGVGLARTGLNALPGLVNILVWGTLLWLVAKLFRKPLASIAGQYRAWISSH
jgi:hypothetical protein